MKKDKRGHYSVKCPICKFVFHFENVRDIKFPENYLLQIIVKEQKRKMSATMVSPSGTEIVAEEIKMFCQLCDEKYPRSSIKRCITCSLNFCEKCLKEIHGNKAFLSHTLSDTSFVTETRIKCYLHPENEIILYCSKDHTLLCDECHKSSHEHHPTRSIQEAFQSETKEVLGMASNFHKAVESCERTIMKLNALKMELDETESEIDQSLFKEFLTLHEEIQLQHTYISERIKSEKLKKKLHIDNFVDSASKSVYKMEGLDHFVAEALKQVNPAVFLQIANPMKSRMKRSMYDVIEPSSTLLANPLKNFHFDFAFIRSQISNLHSKVLQPDHLEFHTEEDCASDNKAAEEALQPFPGSKADTDNTTSNSSALSEEDPGYEKYNVAPSENENNHRFESEYINHIGSHLSPSSATCSSESKNTDVKDQNISCLIKEHDEYAAGPSQTRSSPSYKGNLSSASCAPEKEPGSSSNSSSTDANSNECMLSEVNKECTPEDICNAYMRRQNNVCTPMDISACPRSRQSLLAFRLAGDLRPDKGTNSLPPAFDGNCVEPSTITDPVRRYSDAALCSSDQSLVLPGKPVIYEHTADAHSAKIYWAPLCDNKVVKYYEVQLQEIMSINKGQSFPRDQSGLFSGIKQEVFKATELNANSEYLFRVRAVNSVGRGEWSEPYKDLLQGFSLMTE
ncbi:hypothetical protein NDU88_001858 [Pleurodeles waltl]|uniref:Uncharacterized protein n=1 Tax=Pleurodeles waltl TaxID=8319 RepID=A0AAV7LCL3_PLEWA|nr:hypothetical protein NDU88_001858 [Pleurodeles waltl]